jgi:hypothetical protein
MTDRSTHPRVGLGPATWACRSVGCELPSRDPRDRAGPCGEVYAVAFALYWELVAREGARMEAKTPGIIHATRLAMAMTCAAAIRSAPGGARAAACRDVLEDAGVPIDWQVERLETFVTELRAVAIRTEGSA